MFLFFNWLSFIFQKIILHYHSFTSVQEGTHVMYTFTNWHHYMLFLLSFSVCVCVFIVVFHSFWLWLPFWGVQNFGFFVSFLWLSFLFAMSPSDHFAGLFYSRFFPVQMLQAAASIAPRSVYVCGNTTTTSGLTVSFVWDVSFFCACICFLFGLWDGG